MATGYNQDIFIYSDVWTLRGIFSGSSLFNAATGDMFLHNSCGEQVHQCAQRVLVLVFSSVKPLILTLYTQLKKLKAGTKQYANLSAHHSVLFYFFKCWHFHQAIPKDEDEKQPRKATSSQVNRNGYLVAIFLSLDSLKVAFSFFFFSASNDFLGNSFFVDALHVCTLNRSLSISKQTLFRDGRDSKAPDALGRRKKKTHKQRRGLKTTPPQKKLAAGEERNPNPKEEKKKGKKKKRQPVLFCRSGARERVSACWRALVRDEHWSSLRLARRRRSLITVFVTRRGKIPGGGSVGEVGGRQMSARKLLCNRD